MHVKIINTVVIVIGVTMIAMNVKNGILIPPVLSGIAFVLLGVKQCLKK